MSERGGREGQLEHSGLRPGWTTGACATAATKAAYTALLTGEFPDPVRITLPKNRTPDFALTAHATGEGPTPFTGTVTDDDAPAADPYAAARPATAPTTLAALDAGVWAQAAVTKDAGDDPDATHCAVVRATVRHGEPGTGVVFVGGHGVGTVTLPGLPLAVGEPAINPVPRELMRRALREVRADITAAAASFASPAPDEADSPDPDVVVEIGVDQGVEMARHTWNPRIGILGGLSILGTTGVVVPYSCSAWIDSIRSGINVAQALGIDHVAGCTGATSERVVVEEYGLGEQALLDMGDFVGAVLKHLRSHPRPRLTICGGFAKLSKLANGHLDLHSGRSQVDKGHLASLAASAGADADLVERLRHVNTGLEALTACREAGVPLGDAVARAARDQALAVLDGAPVAVDVVCIDRAGTIVGRADPA